MINKVVLATTLTLVFGYLEKPANAQTCVQAECGSAGNSSYCEALCQFEKTLRNSDGDYLRKNNSKIFHSRSYQDRIKNIDAAVHSAAIDCDEARFVAVLANIERSAAQAREVARQNKRGSNLLIRNAMMLEHMLRLWKSKKSKIFNRLECKRLEAEKDMQVAPKQTANNLQPADVWIGSWNFQITYPIVNKVFDFLLQITRSNDKYSIKINNPNAAIIAKIDETNLEFIFNDSIKTNVKLRLTSPNSFNGRLSIPNEQPTGKIVGTRQVSQ
jgi:hypothetical protein